METLPLSSLGRSTSYTKSFRPLVAALDFLRRDLCQQMQGHSLLLSFSLSLVRGLLRPSALYCHLESGLEKIAFAQDIYLFLGRPDEGYPTSFLGCILAF